MAVNQCWLKVPLQRLLLGVPRAGCPEGAVTSGPPEMWLQTRAGTWPGVRVTPVLPFLPEETLFRLPCGYHQRVFSSLDSSEER